MDFLIGLSIPVIGKILFNSKPIKDPVLISKKNSVHTIPDPIKKQKNSLEPLESSKTIGLRQDLVLRTKEVENHIFGFSPRVEKKVILPHNISLKSSPEGIIIKGEQ